MDIPDECAEFLADPNQRIAPESFFGRLHAEQPLVRVHPGLYMVASYNLATEVLASSDFGVESSSGTPQIRLTQSTLVEPYLRRMMAVRDPPAHSRLRRMVGRAFNPAMAEGMRAVVRQQVDTIFDDFRTKGEIDFIQNVGKPLPTLVSAEMFGVPEADRRQLVAWTELLSGQIVRFEQDASELEVVESEFGRFCDYVERMCLEAKHAASSSELLAALLTAVEEGELDQDELISFVILLLTSGFDTATHMIGNAVLALLRHPEVLDALWQNPGLVPAALRESMRLEPSVRVAARTAQREVTLGPTVIEQGSVVLVLLAAANRDPGIFLQPDRFDLGREPRRHLSFGHGVHYCLGAAIGTVEGEVVMDRVVRTMRNLSLKVPEAGLPWRQSFVFHGVNALPVKFESR